MSLPSITDASESKKKLQCARSRPSSASDRWPVAVAELEERQPAMAGFLAEHAHRVVLAEELLRRDRRDTCRASPSRRGCAGGRRCRSRATDRRCRGRCRVTSLAIVVSYANASVMSGASRPDARADRSCRDASGRTSATAPRDRARACCANRSPTAPLPPAVGPASLRLTGVKTPVRPGESADDRVADG